LATIGVYKQNTRHTDNRRTHAPDRVQCRTDWTVCSWTC